MPPRRLLLLCIACTSIAAAPSNDEAVLLRIFSEALAHSPAHENLRVLTEKFPGRLSGSRNLEEALAWAEQTLGALHPDRIYQQSVVVPHWERGAPERVRLIGRAGAQPLAALALGASAATPDEGLTAPVVEVQSLAEVEQLGRARVAGKVVFFNRPMDPTFITTGPAYEAAGDQRFRGPAQAARFGAIAVLVRSLTFAPDDVPHAGVTSFPAERERGERLGAGATDQPRHTLRCVLFVNEENGSRGAAAYAASVQSRHEKHLLALESDGGGFTPLGFQLGRADDPVHERAAARWRALFEPYGIFRFTSGNGGQDVMPLRAQGATVGELLVDSQRYFDYHHAATDTIAQVNRRELALGAAALASLIWLVDTHGL